MFYFLCIIMDLRLKAGKLLRKSCATKSNDFSQGRIPIYLR
ncbi:MULTISPECIES: hypothetical protein [Helicobacter]|nr:MULTISPECIES: hypothetical protein [Helicobacter]